MNYDNSRQYTTINGDGIGGYIMKDDRNVFDGLSFAFDEAVYTLTRPGYEQTDDTGGFWRHLECEDDPNCYAQLGDYDDYGRSDYDEQVLNFA